LSTSMVSGPKSPLRSIMGQPHEQDVTEPAWLFLWAQACVCSMVTTKVISS
jgi:hypothetical protein